MEYCRSHTVGCWFGLFRSTTVRQPEFCVLELIVNIDAHGSDPLGPEPSALAKLSYAPTSKIPTVDPLRTKSLKPPIHHGEIPSERSESKDCATPRRHNDLNRGVSLP